MNICNPFGKPFYIMSKPIGAMCNLKCDYCYYLHNSNNEVQIMSDELLETFIRQYIESQSMPQVLFTWHGGEPMLRGIDFYKKVLQIEEKYARGRIIDNVLQTNGILMTEEWAKFLHDNGFLIGISIDGPEEFHNAHRGNTFHKVMYAIELLKEFDVMWNAMVVVSNINATHPEEMYNFFKLINAKYIQLTPLVRTNYQTNGFKDAVNPLLWGDFLCKIFDEWVINDVGEYFINIFDATLANWMGETPGPCCFAPTCGQVGVIEYNGDVYSCDHFVYPEYKLGNIKEHTFIEMLFGEQQKKFGMNKWSTLPHKCRKCKYLFACNGECPKNRYTENEYGETGLNYLCEGYYKFFEHVAPFMNTMTNKKIPTD